MINGKDKHYFNYFINNVPSCIFLYISDISLLIDFSFQYKYRIVKEEWSRRVHTVQEEWSPKYPHDLSDGNWWMPFVYAGVRTVSFRKKIFNKISGTFILFFIYSYNNLFSIKICQESYLILNSLLNSYLILTLITVIISPIYSIYYSFHLFIIFLLILSLIYYRAARGICKYEWPNWVFIASLYIIISIYFIALYS